jgi:hypothetical protein
MMPSPILFRALANLTTRENEAARAYTRDALGFHALCQGIRFGDLGMSDDPKGIRSHVRPLDGAIRKFELTTAATVQCGLGWGLPVFGALYPANTTALLGFTYTYAGFISTTTDRAKAIEFMCAGVKISTDRPALLTISLPADFNGLPMQVLGADSTNERELLLGRNLAFTIVDALPHKLGELCQSSDQREVIELFLQPIN